MPEIKNTFLAGKMNKSLDDRLVPEGEYRDALNIQVTKSEGADVGAVQNIKGNTRINSGISFHASAKIIGSVFDDQKNVIYWFVAQGIDATLTVKTQSSNVIFLNSTNAVNAGDVLYTDSSIQGALDTLVVATVDSANNSITVVHDPAGSSGNLVPSLTIPVGTVITFGNENLVKSQVLKYNKSSDTVTQFIKSDISSNDILNFDRNSFVQANVIEDYLFFTDGVNEPRRLDTTKDYSNYSVSDITVAKPAPNFSPAIAVNAASATAGNYLEDKFVRFGYRYKFSDNTYSVYSPFSEIAFNGREDFAAGNTSKYVELSEEQIIEAYSSGEISSLTNKAKTINIVLWDPRGDAAVGIGQFDVWSQWDIVQVDILMKSSNSPAVMLVDTIKVADLIASGNIFTYNSEAPKLTLPENQLTRVYDNVPKKAVAQEIVGNRVIYGNFTQGFNVDTSVKLDFDIVFKETNKDYLALKSNRTYEVGIVFSDDYGRTSPVMFGNNKSVYLDKTLQSNYKKKLAIRFNSVFTDIIAAGFKYYSIVVKQTEQEYYNVYVPGIGYYNGKSYFSLLGNSVNKIPIDTSTFNSETNVNSTKQRVYFSLKNNSIFTRNALTSETNPIFETAKEYDIESFVSGVEMGDYVPITKYDNASESWTPNGATTDFQITTSIPNDAALGDISSYNTFVRVYVNGIQYTTSPPFKFSYNSTDKIITFFEDYIPQSGDSIVVFLQYSNIPIPSGQSRTITSLKQPRATVGNLSVDETGETTEVNLISASYGGIEYINTEELKPFQYGFFEELKITGISTLENFDNINEEVFNVSNGLFGIYKRERKYLLAEVEGEYGVKLFDDTTGKYADLAVLETKPFESAIDIYYETATQGVIDDIILYDPNNATNTTRDIYYYNCINIEAPLRATNVFTGPIWQESRLKGGFNDVSMDFGVQAYITDEDYGLIERESSIIYSGILNNNTKVNNTNQFPSGENIVRTLDPVYGSIQKLYADTNDLLIFQEEKVSNALIDKDIIYTAEGQGLTTAGLSVISQVNAYATNYGIGTNPESFAVYAGRKYFVDRPKGAVLRLSRDGITEISNYGMRSYFRDLLNNPNITNIVGTWDIYNKEYVLSIQSNNSITLGFDESNNGWTTRYSYVPEAGGSLDGNFYTFKRGNLYIHYSNTTHNNFYEQQYDSQIDLIFNQNPSANKNFLTFNYEGSKTWNISNIEAEQDTSVIDTAFDVAAYNINNEDLIISAFKLYDGKFYANIINQSAAKENEVAFGQDVSGIKGYFAKLKIKTDATDYKELFSVSTNYNINSY